MGAILVSKGKLKCPYFGCKEYIFNCCMKFKYFTFEGSALWFRRKNVDAPPEKSKPILKAKCVHFSFGQTILWSPGIVMQNVFLIRSLMMCGFPMNNFTCSTYLIFFTYMYILQSTFSRLLTIITCPIFLIGQTGLVSEFLVPKSHL